MSRSSNMTFAPAPPRVARHDREQNAGSGLISSAVAGPRQRHVALTAAMISLVALVAAALFARVPLIELPAFIPAYEAALVIIDLITAMLLLGQFVQTRSAALLALAAGYLYDGVMIVPHALTFPGVMSPSGWLGAGVHTTAWLYMFWHGGFPFFVLAYAGLDRLAGGRRVPPVGPWHMLWVVAAVISLAVLLTLLATRGEHLLPPIMAGNTDTWAQKRVAGVVWVLTLGALIALLADRRSSVLRLWLIVVMVAWLADIALSAIFDAARFDFGFYVGRLYGLLAASFVLVVILIETGGLHHQLAVATARLGEHADELDREVRQRTAELGRTNRQANAIIEAAPLSIFMLDPAGNVLLWTASAERLFGYTAEEALGAPPPYLDDDELTVFRGTYVHTVAQASSGFNEAQRRRRDGTIIDVSVTWAPVHDEDGTLFGVMYAIADVTERKKLENQLRQAQKMEALGNLTGGLAHDLNNHLGVIILNLELLGERLPDDAEAQELNQEATDAAGRGADLIRHLLAFARRQPLKPQRADVNQLVAETTRLLERTLGEQISITLDLRPGVWPSVIDPVQLESSLTNLANNARDAMPNGGSLRIATDNRQLDEDYAAQHAEVTAGDYAMVEVSDTGGGMPSEVLAQVFDPFFSTKPVGKGTGLGLSMVYGFIKQSGGHINIYSEVGVGTAIRLYLPRADAEAQTVELAAGPALARGSGETILAVEDNPSLRRVIVRQLAELGYRVVEAENALAALAVLETEPVAVLFTDIVMPGGTSGYDLAAVVAARWPDTGLVLTSGFPETRLLEEEWMRNAYLLSKPYRRADVAEIVRRALRRRSAL